MEKPKISVIIPYSSPKDAYNALPYLKGAIDSILAQTIRDQIQLIVVNDGAGEGEWIRIIQPYEIILDTERFICIQHTERRGMSASLNTGIQASEGEYISWMGVGDRWVIYAAEKFMKVLDKHPEALLAYCDKVTVSDYFISEKLSRSPEFSIERYLEGNFISGSMFMYRKSAHDKVGYCREDFAVAYDYDMWARFLIADIGDFHHIQEYMTYYNLNPKCNYSKDLDKEKKEIEDVQKRLKEWQDNKGPKKSDN